MFAQLVSGSIDWCVLGSFVVYLVLMLGIGFLFSNRQESMGDYFLGGRKMNKWVVALSAQASDMSGWLLMGLPGAIFLGAFTFGGGYAMIALLENEFVERKKWIEKDDFLNMVAIAESTPGPVAINSATYIGYKIAGLFGAAATVAVCIPSFTVIFCISLFFDQFLSLTWVSRAFRGIQACVIYLISSAGLKMLKSIERNAFNTVILLSVIAAMLACTVFAVSFSSVYYILICGTAELAIFFLKKLRKGNGN